MRLLLCTPIPVLAAACLRSPTASAQIADALRGRRPVALAEGPNTVDLLHDARPDLVLRGWVENFNAHGFHYITFYVQYPDSSSGATRWDLVPFLTSDQRLDGFSTARGADCVLRDLRVLESTGQPHMPAVVVTAERDFGSAYTDSTRVVFSLYELRTNVTGAPGQPGIAFVHSESVTARGVYCDVNVAFAAELGIP